MQSKRSTIFLFCTIFSAILSIPIFVLSIFNFGLICRWYNGALAIATLIFSSLFLFLRWREGRRVEEPAMGPVITVTLPTHTSDLASDTDSISKGPNSPAAIPLPDPKFPVANSLITLIPLLILSMGYLIAFAIMTDITIRGGVNSTLPAERDPKMTYPWNIKVQIAQTVLIGVQMVVMIVSLVGCYTGRAKISREERYKREEVEAGFEPS